jgi:hypothetical protein
MDLREIGVVQEPAGFKAGFVSIMHLLDWELGHESLSKEFN